MAEHEFARKMHFLIAGDDVVDTRGGLHANYLICLDVVGVLGQDVSVHRQNAFYGGAEAVGNLLQVVSGHHVIQMANIDDLSYRHDTVRHLDRWVERIHVQPSCAIHSSNFLELLVILYRIHATRHLQHEAANRLRESWRGLTACGRRTQ